MQGIRFKWFVVDEICWKNLWNKFHCLINTNLFTIDCNCIPLDWKLFISGRLVRIGNKPIFHIWRFWPGTLISTMIAFATLLPFFNINFFSRIFPYPLIEKYEITIFLINMTIKLVQTCFNLKSYPTLTKNWNSSPKNDLSKDFSSLWVGILPKDSYVTK